MVVFPLAKMEQRQTLTPRRLVRNMKASRCCKSVSFQFSIQSNPIQSKLQHLNPIQLAKRNTPVRSPRNWPYVSFSATSSSTTNKRLPPVLTAEAAAANSAAATLRSDHIVRKAADLRKQNVVDKETMFEAEKEVRIQSRASHSCSTTSTDQTLGIRSLVRYLPAVGPQQDRFGLAVRHLPAISYKGTKVHTS